MSLLKSKLLEAGVVSETLDALVARAAKQIATNVNEEGMDKQLSFLRDVIGMSEVEIADAATRGLQGKYEFITFGVDKEAEDYKAKNQQYLNDITSWILNVLEASYSDVWLNSNCPSYVAGYNDDNEMVICYPLTTCQLNV